MKKKKHSYLVSFFVLLSFFIFQSFSSNSSINAAITIGNRDFVFSDSSNRYLQETELYSLSKDELRIARNEIYARHGRKFENQELQAYFNTKSWYNGTIPASTFNDNVLNQYENYNVLLIKNWEQGLSTPAPSTINSATATPPSTSNTNAFVEPPSTSTSNNQLQASNENGIALYDYCQKVHLNKDVNGRNSWGISYTNGSSSLKSNRKSYSYTTRFKGDSLNSFLNKTYCSELRLDGQFKQLQCTLLIKDKDDGTKGRGAFALYDIVQIDNSDTVESYIYKTLYSTDILGQQYDESNPTDAQTRFYIALPNGETTYSKLTNRYGFEPVHLTIDVTDVDVLGIVLRGNACIIDPILIPAD